MQCMQKGEGGTLRIPLQKNQGNKWEKKSTQATSVLMIILAINVVVSTLENPDVKHILWRKMNCNLIKCFQKNYEHQFL